MLDAAGIIKDSIEEFSRVQNWMLSVKDKDPATYQSMYVRYSELKIILLSLGVDFAKLNKIEG